MSNTIQSTTDYDSFRFLGTNREQNRGHIEQLKKAFEEFGNLTRVSPILVNENMEIIDGQHRFTVCKELGQPLFFTVAPGLGIREARNMNILHANWKTDDYARSYAMSGDKNYQQYLKLREEYGLSHSILLSYINNISDKDRMYAKFREGDLVIKDIDQVRNRLDMLNELAEINPIMTTKPYALSILGFLRIEGYDHNRMVRKLAQYGGELKRFQNSFDAQRLLEEVYNFKMGEGNRLHLY